MIQTRPSLQDTIKLLTPSHWHSFCRVILVPMSWNSLPNSLRESSCDDNISEDCFKHSLKTFLFSGYWHTDCSRGVHDSALYKCTFTYLIIYFPWSSVSHHTSYSQSIVFNIMLHTSKRPRPTFLITTSIPTILFPSIVYIFQSIYYQQNLQSVIKIHESVNNCGAIQFLKTILFSLC